MRCVNNSKKCSCWLTKTCIGMCNRCMALHVPGYLWSYTLYAYVVTYFLHNLSYLLELVLQLKNILRFNCLAFLYITFLCILILSLLMQGYSSKDRKGNLFDDWDLSEAGGSELSEVPFSLLFLLHNSEVCSKYKPTTQSQYFLW